MTRSWAGGSLRSDGVQHGTVLKLGGSLLSLRDWPGLVAALVADQPSPLTIVVGGGEMVDALRRIDAVDPQPAAMMHELAIAAMDVTARLMAQAIGLPLSDRAAAGRSVILRAGAWLAVDDRGSRLPHDWSVTSDSIAATVAAEQGDSLVLAKRVPPDGADLERLAASGWVDRYFPRAARGLRTIAWAAPVTG